jgi:hypothetical protein
MIAMQYSFTLPADYDMAIIDARIRDKGHLFDGFPHLRFKTFLAARQHGGECPSTANLYAPFYLWDEPAGLNDFLSGPGFASVAQAFGWPEVKIWSVWQAAFGDINMAEARYATRSIAAIAPYSDLGRQRAAAVAAAQADVKNGALASVAAYEPMRWTEVRFALWRSLPEEQSGHAQAKDAQIYAVGHMSLPRPE